MTNLQKNEIVQLIETEKNRLGSYAKVATKCEVSTATISQMVNHNWDLIKPELWSKAGFALGFDDSEWQIAETLGYKKVANICNDTKNEAFFMMLSAPAGMGKTAPLKTYYELNSESEVFYIKCREWAKREFLVELSKSLGIDSSKYYVHVDKLGAKVSEFFNQRKGVPKRDGPGAHHCQYLDQEKPGPSEYRITGRQGHQGDSLPPRL